MDTPAARNMLQNLIGISPKESDNGSCITITPIFYSMKRTAAVLANPSPSSVNKDIAERGPEPKVRISITASM